MDVSQLLREELLKLDQAIPEVARVLAAVDNLEARGAIRLDSKELYELRTDIDSLVQRGLFDPSKNEKHSQLIEQLKAFSQGYAGTPRFSVVRLPPLSSLPPTISISTSQLPVDLLASINEIFFLHTLALEPGKALPPGKSLISVLSRPHTTYRTEGEPTLKDRVEASVHKAFWEEAQLSLSSEQPGIQLARLRGLYNDIADAITPLLPSSHPVLTTLRLPPSPTNAPLTSAALHLREVLAAVRSRCAPVRDGTIDALLHTLDEPSPTSLVAVVQGVLKLADGMKDDLAQFVLGAMPEAELVGVVRSEAHMRARAFVLAQWGRETVKSQWDAWVRETPWPRHLMQALCANMPVVCPLPQEGTAASPPTDTNALPASFFFMTPTLLRAQNLLQALVIAAALRVLTRLPAGSSGDFTARVWTLLKSEVDGAELEGGTKLAHLADEVIRARKDHPELGVLAREDEASLRGAVDRTLKPDDPVYLLLQKRVAEAFGVSLEGDVREKVKGVEKASQAIPATMRSGLGGERPDRPGKRMRLDLGGDSHQSSENSEPLVMSVKGFEDPVLVEAVAECYKGVRDVVWWIAEEWEGVLDVDVVLASE